MSHFAVMVVGDDHEGQLAPYHEFECTGMNDEYVQDIDATEELLEQYEKFKEGGKENPLKEALEWFGLENCQVQDENEVEIFGDHKYGYAVVQDGKPVKYIRRTNPNAKWDWYQVGGRWTGFLKLKPESSGVVGTPGLMTEPAKEGWVDAAYVRDIDWEGMMDEAAREASQRWQEIRAVAPDVWESWESVRERIFPIERAREIYNDQPSVKAIRGSDCWANVDSFLDSEETYVEKARKAAVCPFAILHEGEWIERGEMGWWGVISNDSGKDSWTDRAWSFIQSLPEDEQITIVDCHI